MLNKFFKTIHNKYSKLFKFIFFLKYLILITIISIALFFTIPIFFNYEKRSDIIKNFLQEKYKLEVLKYEKIIFRPFPTPNIRIENSIINFNNTSTEFKAKNLFIHPKISSIYNFKNFQSDKIILKDNNATLESSEVKVFIDQLLNLKNKFALANLNLKIFDKNKLIVNIERIKFANYGYNKNLITGKIFNKEFKLEAKNELKNIYFKLLNTGINANINFDLIQNSDLISGTFKSKILNANLKFNFLYDNEVLKIYDSYLRSKNLSFTNNSLITIEPFFDINSKFNIEEFNSQILKKLDLNKIFKSKNFIKKINSKNEINFKIKRFSRNLIEDLRIKVDLAYGSMNYSKKFSISDSSFQCDGNINFLEEYPLLFFNCSIMSNDKQKFLKTFSIKTKNKNEILNMIVQGNISILNKKINFKNVTINNNYKASEEDLKYFKESFQNILFDKSFIDIFDLKKIKEFILEVV